MNRRFTSAAFAAMVGLLAVIVTPSVGRSAEEEPAIAFRAKASLLPSEASMVKGKSPEEIVEIILPGRVYEPPIKVAPVKTRREANWKTPEQASASDFAAFRAADPEWLRENFVEEDYPQIERLVEDPSMRRLNQKTYAGYGEKAIVARGLYKEYALVFAQYDRVAERGVVEVYRKVKGGWKRTYALAQDETVALVQSMFRRGEVKPVNP